MQHNLVNTTVQAQDGEVGKVQRVAMDPNTHRVTHLIIHQGFLSRYVVVPIEKVLKFEPEHLILALTKEELAGCPDFHETDFLAPQEGWDYPVGFPPGGVVWPMPMSWVGASTYPMLSNAVIKENIPDSDVTLATGTAVECSDGHCGHIERVLVDDETHQMTGFVIKKGFLFTRDIQAPMSWIDHVGADGVHLKLTKKQVSEMAAYFD
jgi:sporulation protein YlmC with PRC-barrel domain